MIENVFTLDECLQIAFENNRLISISNEKVTAAREKRRQVSRSQLPVATITTQEQKLKEAPSSSSRDSQDTLGLPLLIPPRFLVKICRSGEPLKRQFERWMLNGSAILEITFQVKKAFMMFCLLRT